MDKIYTAKNDVIFKSLFTKNRKALCAFIHDVLDIPVEDEKSIELLNIELPPEIASGKFSRLDVNVKLPQRSINIEMQVMDKRTISNGYSFTGQSCIRHILKQEIRIKH